MSALFSTDSYDIRVGRSTEEGADQNLYQIINRETGVIEYEDTIMPRTLDACKNLQELLNEAVDNFNKPAESTVLRVVKDDSKPH